MRVRDPLPVGITAEWLRGLRERGRLEPGSEAEAATRRGYESFLPLNAEALKVCSDWQVRPGGVPNDHTDAGYDWAVIDRLRALDARAGPVVRRFADADARFAGYRSALREARTRVEAGDREFLASPRCASYHTVWMQLHEELLVALGLERGQEA